MENRRNYYRILHVQPDAPAEVIKATYRTLMQKLKMHPDLGGDTWNAALVNEAYAVLSDARQRNKYDQVLLKKLRQRAPQMAAEVVQEPKPEPKRAPGHCLFCKTAFLKLRGRATRASCAECRSPLQAIDSAKTQIALQRIARRIEKSFDIAYYTYWPQAAHFAVAMDFSLTGIAMVAADRFHVGQVIKIESPLLRAVAQVKNHKSASVASTPVRVGLKFLTASFELPPGTFIKVTV